MNDASQYPITFGYGATDGIYYGPRGSIGPYHRGEDRAMPDGTPIIVNGVLIGLSNNTGASSGSHLHIGRFVGGQDTAPSGGGFHFDNAVVTEVNQDATNGKYVRIQADGASWVYLHMLEQKVTVGQVLKEEEVSKPTAEQVMDAYRKHLGRDATQSDMDYYSGQDVAVLYAVLLDDRTDKVADLTGQLAIVNSVADTRFNNEKQIADIFGISNPDDAGSIITAINDLKAKANQPAPTPKPDITPPPKPLPQLDPRPIPKPVISQEQQKTLLDSLKNFWKAIFG